MKTVLFFVTTTGRAKAEMLAGVREFMRGTEWGLQVMEFDGTPFPVRELISFWSPIGCIVEVNGINVTKETIPAKAFGDVPVVYLGCESPITPKGATYVVHDAVATANAAARELLSLDFENFAFVGVRGKSWSMRRREAFVAALKIHGRRPETIDFDISTGHAYKREAQRLRAWLDSLPKPCGLMAANDSTAETVLSICRLAGISVPDEIAVVGVDDVESICENTAPTLSSVRPDFRQGGRFAARLLARKLHGGDVQKPAEFSVSGIVRRGSTRFFKRKDSEVSGALERIWAPDGVHLGAKEVLSGFSCSRRNAEIRFRLMTGRSVLQELEAARVQRAKKLLSETSLQVAEVASACGYRFAAHFRRLFRAETGMNPLAWRKANARELGG